MLPKNWRSLRTDISSDVSDECALKIIQEQQFEEAFEMSDRFTHLTYGLGDEYFPRYDWEVFMTYLITKVSSLELTRGKLKFRSRSSVSRYVPITRVMKEWIKKCLFLNFGGQKTVDMIKSIIPENESAARYNWLILATRNQSIEPFHPYLELEKMIEAEQSQKPEEPKDAEVIVFQKGQHEAMFDSLKEFSTGWCIGKCLNIAQDMLDREPMVIVRNKHTKAPKLAICTMDQWGDSVFFEGKEFFVHGIDEGQTVHPKHQRLVDFGLKKAIRVFKD